MSPEPESLILQWLRDMRSDVAGLRETTATKDDLAALRNDLTSDMHSLRADMASDLVSLRADMNGMRRDLSDQIVGLRRAVMEYHTSVIGHGVLISELEARLRKVEQHLSLNAPDAH